MNYTREIIEGAPRGRLALIELAADGRRRTFTFGELADRSGRLAGHLARRGVSRSDVVMTLIGNRLEWVLTMLACFRIGAVVLPCTEQLRARDISLRLQVAEPVAVVCDQRNLTELQAAAPGCEVLTIPDEAVFDAPPAPPVELEATDPCLITFTSGTSGEPKAVLHGQRYLFGQRLQADYWMGVRDRDTVWCTASSGWSKSARNAFIAPWLRGAVCVVHDGRFDPNERLDIAAREQIEILCMSPTEYRLMAKRSTLRPLPRLRRMLAAGEALNPEVLEVWREATGLEIRDGYGQTETGQLTGAPLDGPVRPGSMGRPLPGVRLAIDRGELTVDPQSDPTFFLGYVGQPPARGWWRTGDRVREEDGFLYFEGRTDDVIISSGYRIGPTEVESALISHPAVTDVAVVAAPDETRGSVVRAVIVLGDGYAPSRTLARELQDHVKTVTAPYKYPRIVDFIDELPRTSSGKLRRLELRNGESSNVRRTDR